MENRKIVFGATGTLIALVLISIIVGTGIAGGVIKDPAALGRLIGLGIVVVSVVAFFLSKILKKPVKRGRNNSGGKRQKQGTGSDSGEEPATGMAKASIILGVVSWPLFIAGPIISLPGVICGHMARGRMKRQRKTDGGVALCGLIAGYANLLLVGMIFIWPILTKAREKGRQAIASENSGGIQEQKTVRKNSRNQRSQDTKRKKSRELSLKKARLKKAPKHQVQTVRKESSQQSRVKQPASTISKPAEKPQPVKTAVKPKPAEQKKPLDEVGKWLLSLKSSDEREVLNVLRTLENNSSHLDRSKEISAAIGLHLKSPSKNLRLYAVKALKTWHTSANFDDLLTLTRDDWVFVRKAAIEVLSISNNPQAAKAIVDVYPENSMSAQKALEQIGSAAESETLRLLTPDNEFAVRISACRLLGKIGTKKSISALKNYLSDRKIRMLAKQSIEKIQQRQ